MLSHMATLLIRNLDDHLVAELKRRAAVEHRSVQQVVLQVLQEAVRPAVREPMDLIFANSGRTGPVRRDVIASEGERG